MPSVYLYATKLLNQKRREKGWSQKDLVDTLNVCMQNASYSIAIYSRWENQERAASLYVARELCNILETPMSEMWSLTK